MSNSLPPSLRTEGEGDTVLARMMAEAGVKWRLSPEAEWEKTLARLSRSHAHAEAATRTDIQSQDELKASASKNEASVNDAVNGLEALLDKLDLGHQVDMTSVKRKRKQKISKHKYKKRRKVSSRYNMGGGEGKHQSRTLTGLGSSASSLGLSCCMTTPPPISVERI
jgi:hypothetical protein